MPGLHPTDEPAAAKVRSGAEGLIRSRKDSTRMTTNLLIVDISKISLIATLFVVKCGVPLLELAKWCCSYGLFISKSSHGIEKRGKCVVIVQTTEMPVAVQGGSCQCFPQFHRHRFLMSL